VTDQLAPFSRVPGSCIRNQSQENLLKRTKIVLALPSYNRQRLSGIRRGWCPFRSQEIAQGNERVIRSDSGVAHRLSLSARVLSAVGSQVKAKRQRKKPLWRLHNRLRRARRGQSTRVANGWFWSETSAAIRNGMCRREIRRSLSRKAETTILPGYYKDAIPPGSISNPMRPSS
jgi:hypothetical protein